MPFECYYCSKVFNAKQRLKMHIVNNVCLKRIHQCWCGKSCTSPRALRLHEYKKHKNDSQRSRFNRHKELETIPLNFSNSFEFFAWKENLEAETTTKFVKPRGTKIRRNGAKKTLYVCHRSGNVRQVTDYRKRRPPKKGSCKINAFCPAFISVEEDVEGTIKGEYHGTHWNHENEIHHLTLPKITKEKIADNLKKGATFEEILEDFRNNLSDHESNKLNRIHALTRKDLHNIMQEYKIAFKEKLARDASSIYCLVRECNEYFGDNSPIRLFKPRDVDGSELAENALPEDFILIIMTPTQREILNHFQYDQICVNSTNGLKGFDIHLTTILSIDDSGISLPLAFCISNAVNENIMNIFFSVIKKECKNICVSVFVSEECLMYINAWCKIFGAPRKWQVDKNLRQNLQKSDRIVELKSDIDLKVRSIMVEMDEQIFVILFKKFIAKLLNSVSTKHFGLYFEKEFFRPHSKSSYNYTKHIEIRTKVKLEAMYCVLRDVYFKGLKVRRIDFSIFRLLKASWENLFSKLPRVTTEDDLYTLKILKDRHNTALLMPSDCITKNGTSYEFQSQTDDDRTFLVEMVNENCSCQHRCIECDTCFHSYSCTCIDYLFMGNFCEHVHAVNIYEKKLTAAAIDDNYDQINRIPIEVKISTEDVENVKLLDERICDNHAKEKLIDTLLHLTHLLQTNTYESNDYEEGAKLLDKALSIFYKTKLRKVETNELLNECGNAGQVSPSPKKESCDESEISITEPTLLQNQIDDDDTIIGGVEEIVYVDVYTSNDNYF